MTICTKFHHVYSDLMKKIRWQLVSFYFKITMIFQVDLIEYFHKFRYLSMESFERVLQVKLEFLASIRVFHLPAEKFKNNQNVIVFAHHQL